MNRAMFFRAISLVFAVVFIAPLLTESSAFAGGGEPTKTFRVILKWQGTKPRTGIQVTRAQFCDTKQTSKIYTLFPSDHCSTTSHDCWGTGTYKCGSGKQWNTKTTSEFRFSKNWPGNAGHPVSCTLNCSRTNMVGTPQFHSPFTVKKSINSGDTFVFYFSD